MRHLTTALLLLASTCAAGATPHRCVVHALLDPGCPACAEFRHEGEGAYRASALGAQVPLVEEDFRTSKYGPVWGTPTFVVTCGGRRVGEIQGYLGETDFEQ